jgi:hypothetical protein
LGRSVNRLGVLRISLSLMLRCERCKSRLRACCEETGCSSHHDPICVHADCPWTVHHRASQRVSLVH